MVASAEVWFGFLAPCQSQAKDLELIQTGEKNEEAQKLQGIHESMKLLVLQSTKQLLLLTHNYTENSEDNFKP